MPVPSAVAKLSDKGVLLWEDDGQVHTFDGDGKSGQSYVEPWPTQTAGLGVAQDRMKRLVVAEYKSKPGELDAWM